MEETTLLGTKIQSDLRWNSNTDFMCEKAFNRVWMIRRLKSLGASNQELVDVYCKQVRCVLELAAPVWTPGLTSNQIAQIERVQKTVCAIVLAEDFTTYEEALKTLELSQLSIRRKDLNLRFAKKYFHSDKYRQWFEVTDNDPKGMQTRSVKPDLKPVDCRTRRYNRSPLPYLTSLLNENWKN